MWLEGWLRRYHVLPGAEIVPDGPARLYLRDRQTIPVVEVALATRAPERFTAVLYGARRIDAVAADKKMNGRVFLGARSSVQGVIPVGVVVETTGEQDGRLMVVGDADFLAGALFQRESNRLLFARMVRWLSEGSDPGPAAGERYAYAPLTVRQAHLLFWTVMAPPLGFLVGGGLAWWRRKRG